LKDYDPSQIEVSNANYDKQQLFYSVDKESKSYFYYRVLVPAEPKERGLDDFKKYLIFGEIIYDSAQDGPVEKNLSKPEEDYEIMYNITYQGLQYDSFVVKTTVEDFAKEESEFHAIWYYDFILKKGKRKDENNNE
jgi:hypothetical protein